MFVTVGMGFLYYQIVSYAVNKVVVSINYDLLNL